MFGPRNPMLAWVESAAEYVRENRRPVATDNLFLSLQEKLSEQIVDGFEGWRAMSERLAEETFRAVYGAAPLQAALGIDPSSSRPPRKAPKSLLSGALLKTRVAALKEKITLGGLLEGLARSLLYVGMARGSADERGFEVIRRIRRNQPAASQLTLAEFKALIREQYFMLLIDEAAALAAIPALLPTDMDERRKAFDVLRDLLESSGVLEGAAAERLDRVAGLFNLGKSDPDSDPVVRPNGKPARPPTRPDRREGVPH
jgi:hypothetical protein